MIRFNFSFFSSLQEYNLTKVKAPQMNQAVVFGIGCVVFLALIFVIAGGSSSSSTSSSKSSTASKSPSKSPSPPSFKYPSGDCTTKYTDWNDHDDGRVQYLDRHQAKCGPNEYMTRFGLETGGQNQMRYRYRCCPASGTLTSTPANTAWNEDGNGSIAYLDRHLASCGDSGMGQYWVSTKSPASMDVNWDCRKPSSSVKWTCTDKTTDWNDTNNSFRTEYMDRHLAVCDDTETLSKLQLQTGPNATIRYAYTCCKPS
jgi:hypothetical protein